MLIEAGTYRFNDDITLYGSGTSEIYIDFTVAGVYLGYSFTANCSYFYTDIENNIFRYWADSTYPVFPYYPNGVFLTVYGDGWSSDFDENVRFVNILTDTYVPTNFGLWATSNWEKVEEEPEAPPVMLGPVSSSDITPYLIALQEQISVSTTVEVLAVTTTGVVGLVFMWWGVRKVVHALMAAFKKGKISL